MSKKFVVGVEGLSTEQQRLLKDFINKDGSGWWHAIEGFWLVDAMTDELTPPKIRDKINNMSRNSNALVLEVSPITWASFGPESKDFSFKKWVEEYWVEDE